MALDPLVIIRYLNVITVYSKFLKVRTGLLLKDIKTSRLNYLIHVSQNNISFVQISLQKLFQKLSIICNSMLCQYAEQFKENKHQFVYSDILSLVTFTSFSRHILHIWVCYVVSSSMEQASKYGAILKAFSHRSSTFYSTHKKNPIFGINCKGVIMPLPNLFGKQQSLLVISHCTEFIRICHVWASRM